MGSSKQATASRMAGDVLSSPAPPRTADYSRSDASSYSGFGDSSSRYLSKSSRKYSYSDPDAVVVDDQPKTVEPPKKVEPSSPAPPKFEDLFSQLHQQPKAPPTFNPGSGKFGPQPKFRLVQKDGKATFEAVPEEPLNPPKSSPDFSSLFGLKG